MLDFAEWEAWFEVVRRQIELEIEVLQKTHSLGDWILYGVVALVIFLGTLFYLKLKRPAYKQVGMDMKSKKEDLIAVHQRGNYTNQYDLTEDRTKRIKSMAGAKVGDRKKEPDPEPDAEALIAATLAKTDKKKNMTPPKDSRPKIKANTIRGGMPNLDNPLIKGESAEITEEIPVPKELLQKEENVSGLEPPTKSPAKPASPKPSVQKAPPQINELTRKKIDELLQKPAVLQQLEKKGIEKEDVDLETLANSGLIDGLLETMVSPVKIEEADEGKFSKMSLDIELIFDNEDFNKPKR